MSYLVTRLVRTIRLPAAVQNRPAAKGVLLALADDCWDDGSHAFTALTTVTREAEISRRSAQRHLDQLRVLGLIAEQQAPTQHRPRMWCLCLPAIAALADMTAVATLADPDVQLVATLRAEAPPALIAPEVPPAAPEVQLSLPEVSAVVVRGATGDTRTVERLENGRTSPAAPQFAALALAPSDNHNFAVIRALALELLDQHATVGWPDLLELVKQRCAALLIDYGRVVPIDVLHRACASAQLDCVKRRMATAAEQPTTRRRRRG